MDGYITIGTKLDSSNLDDELRTLKKELSKYERENEMLLKQKTKLELDTADAEKKVEELNQKIQETYAEKARVKSLETQTSLLGNPTFRYEERETALTAQAQAYENEQNKILEVLKKQDEEMGKINAKIQNNVNKQALLKGEIINANSALNQQQGFEKLSKGLSGIISKVTKWGLALFGIRGAYSMISRAMSTLSQQDKNMASQIQYIQWALAQAIAPVVKFIINAVKLIMDYINKIWTILFGHDLFKGPKEFASSMKSASGSAQKIQKSLAGFDEMNILGDNTASAGGVGGGGVATPEFDTDSVIKGLDKVKNKVKELKETYVKSTNDMGKALSDPKAFKLAYGNWDWLMMGIVEIMSSINKIVIGFGQIFGGVFDLIKGIATLNLKTILEAFIKMGEGVANIWRGIFGIIDGIFMTIIGVIKGVVLSIINLFSGVPKAIGKFFTDAKDRIMKVFSAETGKKIGKALTDGISNAVKWGLNWIIDKINSFTSSLNKIKISIGGKDYGFNIKKIPRLAKGTILNNPGRGVPVAGGNAIAGEAGREAYLPLSDSQLLEELGSTIGRYITINLTNETNLDGRTIARKVSQLSNNDNFLRNR